MKRETAQTKNNKINEKRHTLNSYNEFKEFKGRKYTGMKVGRSHKWYYDKGEWSEKKTSPDEWMFTYSVDKTRAGNAPEGSGVPVGTEYHWYILADQNVKKMDANRYTTAMTGIKYKLAHKRASQENWNITEREQKMRLIQLLEALVVKLTDEINGIREHEKQENQLKTKTAAVAA
jgi:hypothetical protein